jgi:hypothetical protein
MEIVVADHLVMASAITEEPVATTRRDATEPLHVDVHELARPLADIANGGAGEAVGVSQTTVAVAAQDGIDGRPRMTEQGAKAMGADAQSAPGQEDPSDLTVGEGARLSPWP